MNVQEGARRMKRAGQWLIMVPLTIVILIWVVVLTATLQHGRIPIQPLIFVIVPVYLAIPGGALWIAGWIVEGFAKDSK